MKPIITQCFKNSSVTLMVLLFSCGLNKTDNYSKLSLKDTTDVVQSVLVDRQLESELVKDFGNQQLKLVVGPASKIIQKFKFAGKPVRIVSLSGDIYQIHQQHPKEFYVSVPEVNFFSDDSAAVLLIFHSGNATALFNLKNEKGKWIIKERQYGKF